MPSDFTGYIPGFDDPEDIFRKPEPPSEPHEHKLISGLLSMGLYFGGGLAVIIAIMLLVAPATLEDAINTILGFVGSISGLIRDVGTLFGLK